MQQTRLADARFADNIDDAQPSLGIAKATLQHVKLFAAPDIGGEAAVDGGVEPRRTLSNTVEPIDALALDFALDLALSDERAFDEPIHQPMRGLAQQHTAGVGKRLQSRGQVDSVPERRDSGAVAAPHAADDRLSGVDANPHLAIHHASASF